MSAESAQLTGLLKAELSSLQALQGALDAEYQALIDNKIEDLEHATISKNTAVAAHRAQQGQRISWMQGLGLSPDSPLGELVSHCGSHQADIDLQNQLKSYSGLSNVDDDLPYGKSQLIYKLTPAGESAGLRLEQVGRQLRAAFDGIEVQTFFDGRDEISVRLLMTDDQRNRLSTLTALPIVLPDSSITPISNVLEFTPRQGFDSLSRIDGLLSINVSADLDESNANANDVIADLQANVMPTLLTSYSVEASFEGKNRDQRETLADMQTGLVIALILIYVILAWVFGSYIWPINVMLTIPLGLTGAILGLSLIHI